MERPLPPTADPAFIAAAAEAIAASDGEPEVPRVLLALAAVRPSSGWEMARAVDAAAPGAIAGREGGFYPLLAELVRAGRLEARWEADAERRPRRVYCIPGTPAGDPGPGFPPLASAAPPSLHRAAQEAAKGVPGDFERESARAEVLSHLESSTAAYARLGLGWAEAARAALRDFGDPWKVRTDLARVHRGRTVVVFPRTLAERLRGVVIYDLVPLAVVLALLLLVRWQVVQAYNIPTKSMEPTLHGEEDDPDFILVDKTAFLRRDLGRWDIVVFYPPLDAERRHPGDDRSAFVKRCVGLGGETVDIWGGDLYINEALARRPPEVEDSMMVPLYDLGTDLKDAASRARLSPVSGMVFGNSWEEGRPGTWTLRGGRLEADPGTGGEARLAYLRALDNSYTEPDGRTVDSSGGRGGTCAGDLEVRFLAEAGSPEAVVGADLTEGTGDAKERHRLRVGPRGVTITSGKGSWTSRFAQIHPGRPVDVRFRNVDDRLTAWVDGEVVLRVELTPRTFPPPRDPAPGGVELVAEGGPASFGGVRILRDVVYLRLYGDSSWPRHVPEGSYFMLGDNTGNSLDSRVWGTVEAKDLIGLPFAVVYPPTRAKFLR